ncbi:MAG: phosphoribosyltransferase family protein, partial [Actinomyces sp.]|nr:phosphoribosyltransferase family protein [Actinomyces sp.]
MSASTPFDDGATTNTGEERENLTWQEFGDAARELAQQIVNSGWKPDLIVAIARGGLIPAGAIAYAMGVKAIGTMNLEFYTGLGETLDEPQVLPPLMDVSALDGKKVLV